MNLKELQSLVSSASAQGYEFVQIPTAWAVDLIGSHCELRQLHEIERLKARYPLITQQVGEPVSRNETSQSDATVSKPL